MIVGSGLIAKAFSAYGRAVRGLCIYAAGVANSSCTNPEEYRRDWCRLQQVARAIPPSMPLVYFSTCSMADPSSQTSRYVAYKKKVELFVAGREKYLLVRLPQVAGTTSNPNTLLNYLDDRIRRRCRFDLWKSAVRNVIDVEDAAHIVIDCLMNEKVINETIDVANTRMCSLFEIVDSLERANQIKANYSLIEKGESYTLNTARIAQALRRCEIQFDDEYLDHTIKKYYGINRLKKSLPLMAGGGC